MFLFPAIDSAIVLMQAINMIEHQDEIYARPARTWFQVRSICSCQMHHFLIVIEIK